MAGVFCFFTVLFFVNIMFALVSYFVKRFFRGNEHIRFLIIFILFLLGNLITYFGLTIPRFNNSLAILLIYYFGYLYKKYEKTIKFNLYMALICFMILCSNCFYGSINVAANNYLSPDFLIVSSITGIYLVLYISKFISRKNKASVLLYIGKNTTVIMALQFVAFKIIAIIQIYVYEYPKYYLAKFPVILGSNGWWILYSIVGVAVPVGLKHILDRKINNIRMTRCEIK